MLCRFQSTPPARGATDDDLTISVICTISIHAPREGGDYQVLCFHNGRNSEFQSTPPAWGATLLDVYGGEYEFDISIHAPREGGDIFHGCPPSTTSKISIHAPREGGDRSSRSPCRRREYFNPRPPRGGRQRRVFSGPLEAGISIHAPREGGDSKDAQFYPRIFDK